MNGRMTLIAAGALVAAGIALMNLDTPGMATDTVRTADAKDPYAAGSCRVSYAKFMALNGNSDPISQLGCRGTTVSESNAGGTHYRTLVWDGERPGSKVILSYEFNRLIDKTQIGLQ